MAERPILFERAAEASVKQSADLGRLGGRGSWGCALREGPMNAGSTLLAVCLLVSLTARSAEAQQSISDVLSFLVTNRTIATDDFVRDEQAAIATRDTIANLLVLELSTLPSSSGGGFTYEFDPALGTVIRASDSFGPLFTERSLGAGQVAPRSASAIEPRPSTASTAGAFATAHWCRPRACSGASQSPSTSRRCCCGFAPTR